MDIIATNVGYRELDRIARFIDEINKGKETFNNIVENNSFVIISYDLKYDDVVIMTEGNNYYPADLDIEY
ncbi:MAG: hypothetical protein K6F34_11430 [Lachnospiraceae bacterium]|nr:hypothetical protein [Lachnospiraceae bacterium]